MIAAIFASAWYVLLVSMAVGIVLFGRPRRERAAGDPVEAYDRGRWGERSEHVRRVREEELAELRRQAPR